LNIKLFLTPEDFQPDDLKGKAAVIIDVLRASSSIVTAFHNQCHQIIPVTEVETARKLAAFQSKDTTLLCGEREGRKIQGFHLGNSPNEYTLEKVKHKTLIFTSTNGSRLMIKSKEADISIVASFINISAVVAYLVHKNKDVVILCAGSYGQFSLEDTVCGGLISAKLFKQLDKKLVFDDLMLAAMLLSQKFDNDIIKMLHLAKHGRYLINIGFQNDLVTCARLDSIDLVPVFQNGLITLPRAEFI